MIIPFAGSRATTETAPIRWGWILAAWTAIGLFNAGQYYVSSTLFRDVPVAWWLAVVMQMPVAWTWALATPAILALGRRLPITRRRPWLPIGVHIACGATLILATAYGYAWHADNVLPLAAGARSGLQVFWAWLMPDGLIYAGILMIGWSVERNRWLREKERAATELQAQLAQAQLQALQMQLQPHFLFNALHTIGTLVRRGDRDGAVRVVSGLGELLRRLLDRRASQEVPLREEVAFLRMYVDIEQTRFPDRLRAQIDVPDEVLDAWVPPLILQPLVENAIRHGLAPHRAAGALVVSAQRKGARLVLSVRDDGPGETAAHPKAVGTGIGLANMRERLARLYSDEFTVEVRRGNGCGHEALVTIPFRVTAESAPG